MWIVKCRMYSLQCSIQNRVRRYGFTRFFFRVIYVFIGLCQKSAVKLHKEAQRLTRSFTIFFFEHRHI